MALEAALGEHSSFLLAVGQGTDDGRWRVVVALDAQASRRLQRASEQPELRAVRQAVWVATDEEAAGLRKIVEG
jgi:hypothetical protein